MSGIEVELPPTLVYSPESPDWYQRKRWGRGFRYLNGKKVLNNETELSRIRALVLPPMWRSVRINPQANGHLQATGRDARKRKQYFYHPEYAEFTNLRKFERMFSFSKALSGIREDVNAALRKRGWPREKALALAVKLLDETAIRIGNRNYARMNDSYGLLTLRRKHLSQDGSCLMFSYRGKSGVARTIRVIDPRVCRLIKSCSELPGYELLKFRDQDGGFHKLHSHDVNAYLSSFSPIHPTAKDFRTWHGTVALFEFYEEALEEQERYPRRKLETILLKKVAGFLGNTVAVCRKYYVHPQVLEFILKHGKHKPEPVSPGKTYRQLSLNERRVVRLLQRL